MCTFIMLYGLLDDYPIVALHNRYLELTTVEKTPQPLEGDIYCPVDVASKGTWIGLNKDGLLLAITNQETQSIDKPDRSRGLLALDVLRECSSSCEAKKYLFDPSIREQYRPGNFMVADNDEAWHILWDKETKAWGIKPGPFAMGVVTMYPGIKLNDRAERIGLDSEMRRKRAYQLLRGYQPKSVETALEKMMEVSADHEYGKTTSSICWHSKDFKQTSSTIVAVGSNPVNSRAIYCIGNACDSVFNSYLVSFQ
ncbi:hypothetical protein E2P71_07940 [Candidatus Bathyarchaeota archaeon]|nr:hypothetical protein E2P71_07940 [Candidatus Bathyarchaeota archaeon]